jgi:hypothetical protein
MSGYYNLELRSDQMADEGAAHAESAVQGIADFRDARSRRRRSDGSSRHIGR